MRDHDLELIAALAEGTLEDESEARVLIESSEEHRLEYEAQRSAISALSHLSPASLSESERASMHREVWTELRTRPTTTLRRTPWYYRWAPVAASLFVVVGIVAILNQQSQPASETFREIGSSLGGGGDGGESAVATTSADSADVAEEALTADEAASFYKQTANELRSGRDLVDSGAPVPADAEGSALDLETCLEEAGLTGYTIVHPAGTGFGLLTAPPGLPSFFTAIPDDGDLETSEIAFVDADRCEVVHREE